MRHENRYYWQFHTFLFVISFAHSACSQQINTSQPASRPLIINDCKGYNNSIKNNINKALVPLKSFITPLFTDFKYATSANFTHTVLYHNPVPYARLEAARALQKVQEELASKGLSLKFFDAYRPYIITKKMWKIVPDEKYAVNPAKGSGHNRGAAVDVTLVKIENGEELAMPTPFDDFTTKAHHNYMQLPAEVIANRRILRSAMESSGFVALETEWWHYSLPKAAEKYELLDLDFDELEKITNDPKYCNN